MQLFYFILNFCFMSRKFNKFKDFRNQSGYNFKGSTFLNGQDFSINQGGPLNNGFGSLPDLFSVLSGSTDYGSIIGSAGNKTNHNTFAGALNSLNGSTGIADALSQMLSGYSGSGVSTERNDMFYQFLLQLLATQDQRLYDQSLTKDQREYDWNLLQDQRSYNLPINELMRLMSTGISRDAAIQILSGVGSSGTGVGSSGVVNSGPVNAPSVSAPSGTMAVNYANMSIAALQSLVNSGVNLATGIAQIQSQQSANYWSKQQISANESVTELASALQSMQDQGIIDSSLFDSLSNPNDLVNYLNSLSKDNEQVSQLLQSNSFKTALGTPFGRQRFNDYWKSIRDSRDSGTLYDEFIRQQRLNNFLTEVNTSKVGAELSLINAQTKSEYQSLVESATRIASMEADIQVKNAQGVWIRLQSDNYQRLADAEYNQIVAQTEGTQIQNKINHDLFELNHAGFPMLKQIYIDELRDKIAYWSTIKDPKVREFRQNTWFQNERNAYLGAYVENLRINAVGDFAESNPALFKLVNAFHDCGAGNLVRTGISTMRNVVDAVRAATPLP